MLAQFCERDALPLGCVFVGWSQGEAVTHCKSWLPAVVAGESVDKKSGNNEYKYREVVLEHVAICMVF